MALNEDQMNLLKERLNHLNQEIKDIDINSGLPTLKLKRKHDPINSEIICYFGYRYLQS